MKMKVITHSGIFHADETAAVAALKIINPDLEVVRTRNPDVIKGGDVVVDVGLVHDPETGRFDHHQKGGAGARDPKGCWPYAAAGLVWEHYGTKVVQNLAPQLTDSAARGVADKVDQVLVRYIDAADNGITATEGPTISALVSGFIPTWMDHPDEAAMDAAFLQAVAMVESLLRNSVNQQVAEVLAEATFLAEAEAHADGEVLVIDRFMPWQSAVVNHRPKAKVVVFPGQGGTWMAQAAPLKLGTFENRIKFPSQWAGLNGKDLAQATGVQDAVFAHNGRFIAGAGSRDGALELALQALE